MLDAIRQILRRFVACMLIAVFAGVPGLLAQTHVVSPDEMQKQVVAATQARQRHLDTVTQFLSSPKAEKAMKTARMNPEQVKTAVATLSDQELADLASRAQNAQADFAAGRLSDRDLLLIILGVAALVLIIVAVR